MARHARLVVVVLSIVANVAGQACQAKIADDGADAGLEKSEAAAPCEATASPAIDASPPPPPPIDATREEASGPKICNPNDPRTCEVATAAEGAPCPSTYDVATATFTCAGAPVGTRWYYGRCADHLIASLGTFRHAITCHYDATSHILIGSEWYDDCGGFCGDVNRIHWGRPTEPCVFFDVQQGICSPDAGPDAADGGG